MEKKINPIFRKRDEHAFTMIEQCRNRSCVKQKKKRKKKDEKEKKTEKSLSIEKKKEKKDFFKQFREYKGNNSFKSRKVEKIKLKQPRYQFPKDK